MVGIYEFYLINVLASPSGTRRRLSCSHSLISTTTDNYSLGEQLWTTASIHFKRVLSTNSRSEHGWKKNPFRINSRNLSENLVVNVFTPEPKLYSDPASSESTQHFDERDNPNGGCYHCHDRQMALISNETRKGVSPIHSPVLGCNLRRLVPSTGLSQLWRSLRCGAQVFSDRLEEPDSQDIWQPCIPGCASHPIPTPNPQPQSSPRVFSRWEPLHPALLLTRGNQQASHRTKFYANTKNYCKTWNIRGRKILQIF